MLSTFETIAATETSIVGYDAAYVVEMINAFIDSGESAADYGGLLYRAIDYFFLDAIAAGYDITEALSVLGTFIEHYSDYDESGITSELSELYEEYSAMYTVPIARAQESENSGYYQVMLSTFETIAATEANIVGYDAAYVVEMINAFLDSGESAADYGGLLYRAIDYFFLDAIAAGYDITTALSVLGTFIEHYGDYDESGITSELTELYDEYSAMYTVAIWK